MDRLYAKISEKLNGHIKVKNQYRNKILDSINHKKKRKDETIVNVINVNNTFTNNIVNNFHTINTETDLK